MYSMVLMAALTTGIDMPDRGGRRRGGGGCCGCYGGMYYGGGYGGCYGGMGMGYGGCYGGGYGGGWGGGYGRGYAWGGYGAWGGGGYAYSPFSGTTSVSPTYGGNAYLGWGNNLAGNYGTMRQFGGNLGMMQSNYFNPGFNQGNEARIIVHLPADARLTIDGEPTQSMSSTRVFLSPPLEAGKTYHYTLRGEVRRNNQTEHVSKTIDVQAGRPTEITLQFRERNQQEE